MNRFVITGAIITVINTLLTLQAARWEYMLTASLVSAIGGFILYHLGAADGSRRTIAYLQQEFDLIQDEIDAEIAAAEADINATGSN